MIRCADNYHAQLPVSLTYQIPANQYAVLLGAAIQLATLKQTRHPVRLQVPGQLAKTNPLQQLTRLPARLQARDQSANLKLAQSPIQVEGRHPSAKKMAIQQLWQLKSTRQPVQCKMTQYLLLIKTKICHPKINKEDGTVAAGKSMIKMARCGNRPVKLIDSTHFEEFFRCRQRNHLVSLRT